MSDDIVLLHQKIDRLIVMYEAQQTQLQAVTELKQDVMPIINSVTKIMIEELAELGEDFQIEDFLFLIKRLLRKNRLLIKAMDRIETLMDLIDEAEFLGRHVFNDMVDSLEKFENAGYFNLACEGMYVADKLVSDLKPGDIRRLGDKIPSFLQAAVEEPEDKDISVYALIKSMADPQVRKGMARMLNIVRVFGNS